MGNAIELVVVATGFEGDEDEADDGDGHSARTDRQACRRKVPTLPESRCWNRWASPARPLAQTRPLEQVILGEKSTRYSNIDQILAKPAYQSRKAQFIVEMPAGRKEVLKEEKGAAERAEENRSESLFD